MNDSLVSIIVPVYNQADYLVETLDSVLSQTYNLWECIIINDGSIDDSERIALEYCKKDSRFSYIYQENQGVVSARNNAIAQSHGKYILLLDGDDMISPEYLELAVPILEKDELIKIVHCEVEMFGDNRKKMFLPDVSIRNLLSRNCCVCTSLFRRIDFDRVGGFKEYMKKGLEDWDFFLSLLAEGGETYKLNKPLFFYRILSKSRNRTIDRDTHNVLIGNIVSNHSLLYYNEYCNLLKELQSIQNSRVYKLLQKLRSSIMFMKRLLKCCL